MTLIKDNVRVNSQKWIISWYCENMNCVRSLLGWTAHNGYVKMRHDKKSGFCCISLIQIYWIIDCRLLFGYYRPQVLHRSATKFWNFVIRIHSRSIPGTMLSITSVRVDWKNHWVEYVFPVEKMYDVGIVKIRTLTLQNWCTLSSLNLWSTS